MPKKPKKPDTPEQKAAKEAHVKIRDRFCIVYEARCGIPYHFMGGKDGKCLKMLIKMWGEFMTGRLMQTMFETKPKEYWSIGFVLRNCQELAVVYSKKERGLTTPKLMTAKQEEAHYASHRRSANSRDSSEFKSIGETLSKIRDKNGL